jgi:N,N'-diacetylchitobiose transport system substrate-binding protein
VFLPFHMLPGFSTLAGGIESFTSGLVGGLVKTFPGYFCGDMKDAAKGLVDTIKSDALKGSKDSLKDMCEKKGKDVDGFAFNGGSDANHLLGSLAWSEGGEYAVKENGKWVGKVTDPAFKAGFATYTSLVTDGLSSKSRLTQNTVDIRKRFANNKVGMYLTAGWDLPGIEEDSNGKLKGDKLAFLPLPAKAGGEAPSFFGGNDIAIWKDAKNKELATEYIKLATNKEWAGRYASEGGLLPIYPEALAKLSSDPVQAPFAAAFAKAKAFPADPNWTEANETKAVLQNAARSVIEGKSNADDALAKAKGELEEILNQQ